MECDMSAFFKLVTSLVAALIVIGCSGTQTFPNSARAGDTVALAVGYKHFTAENMTVTITPTVGPQVVYSPGSTSIRSIVNLYADPLSSLIVSDESNTDVTPFARTYSGQIKTNFTGGSKEFWQTVVFVDLPPALATGMATVDISSTQGESASVDLDVISGTGAPEQFIPELLNGPMNGNHLISLARVDHYEIDFTGSTVPYAIQLDLDYTTLIGHLVNPRGDLKNLSWNDTGTGYKVIITSPSNPVSNIQDFKFYVAIAFGTVSGTTLSIVPGSMQAFDQNGNPVTGVNATVTLVEGVAGLYDI